MTNDTSISEPDGEYAAAYAAHYTERDLPMALELYMRLVSSHPDTLEAGFARTQIQNIVNTVVPKQDILNAQIELAVAHFEHEGSSSGTRQTAEAVASGLST